MKGIHSSKLMVFVLLILASNTVSSQENEDAMVIQVRNPSEDIRKLPLLKIASSAKGNDGKNEQAKAPFDQKVEIPGPPIFTPVIELVQKKSFSEFAENSPSSYPVDKFEPLRLDIDKDPPVSQAKNGDKFHWKAAIGQSLLFLGFQHGIRMFQPRTREYLDGRFFHDWGQSLRNLRGWRDGDAWYINYVGHPLQGAITGRFFINNSDAAKKLEFENTSKYWKTQLKVMAWQTFWSTQYELGPLGEANIGNVGFNSFDSHKLTWLDLVITPTWGTGLSIGEDMIDKYILKQWIEKKIRNKMAIRTFRFFLTPSMTIANLFRIKEPWHRNNRKF